MREKQTIIFDSISITIDPDKCIKSLRCSKRMPSVFSEGDPVEVHPGVNDDLDTIIEAINNCPSGALSWEYTDSSATRATTESRFSGPTARVIANGPLVVTGELELEYADGSREVRNRTSFCRCGASKEKPLCDGSHDLCGFRG